MRNLTPQELTEYLQYCKTSGESDGEMPDNWEPLEEEKRVELHQVVKRHMFTNMLEDFAADDMAHGRKAALIALWITAFQCGREFETMYKERRELEAMVK